jgi:FkbM family methyltransferase
VEFNFQLNYIKGKSISQKIASKKEFYRTYGIIKNMIQNESGSPLQNMNESCKEVCILGSKMRCYSLSNLRSLFNEIFLANVYYFSTVKKNPFIIDCGSNIGMTILYFKKLYPKSQILGFEPAKGCYELLKSNIFLNHLDHVKVVQKALSNKRGICYFTDSSYGKGSGMAHLVAKPHKRVVDSYFVKCDLLSRYISKPVDFLKMDIEGGEFKVFQDLNTTGKIKLVKEMVVEVHIYVSSNPNDDLAQFFKILEKNGFGYQFRGMGKMCFSQLEPQAFILYAYQKKLFPKKRELPLISDDEYSLIGNE